MAGEWRKATVSELQQEGILLVEDGNHGEYRPRSNEFVSNGVAFIRAADMDNGRVCFFSAEKINEQAQKRITKGIGAPGDILLSHKGTVGKVAFVPDNAPPFVCSPQTTFWRTRDERVLDRRYLYAFLRSPIFHAQLATRSGETDMAPYVSLTSQRNLSVMLPPIQEQRTIAHILGTLDDKIELNRRMGETLEAMARALFKSWFVDFDPVRANAEGRNPNLPKPIADLFPDRFIDSELGRIPEGWEVALAGHVFDVGIGKTPPRKEHHWFSTNSQDVPWMSIKDLGQAKTFISEASEYLTPDAVDRFRVRRIPDGTVVLSFKLTVGRVAITNGEMLSNEAIAHFVPRDRTFLSAAYLYCYLHQFDFESLGSTSSIATAVNSDSIRGIPVFLPSEELHRAFLRAISPSFLRLRTLHRESRILTTLRDALLPKLISGQVRISKLFNKGV